MIKTINVILVLLAAGMLSLDTFGQNVKLPESTIKTVYITPFSHYDLGFVEPPDSVRERAARHIDEVIRVAEENPDFKWTIESVWQVNEWLNRQRKPESVLPRDKVKIERLMKLIRSGRVAISMAWGSMHTDFMGAEELNRLVYDFTKLKSSYNITSELAMMNDVPGHPTSLPSVMEGSGVKYMVTGANTFIGNATALAPGNVPFYWEGPDGSKVLLWISQGNRGAYVEAVTEYYLDPFSLDPYTARRPFEMFNPDMIGKTTPLQEMEIGMTNLIDRYNQAGYKYDAVMAMYSHDFVEPTDVLNLRKAIALWKQHHPEIELKIATPPEFFKYIEAKYGTQIPTFRGEWSGLWSEAKTQSPLISASARYNHDHAPAAETLWSAIAMTRQIPAPVGNISSIFDLMFTYDEHSGAGNNGWPQLNSRRPLEDQNRQYVEFISRAKKETEMLLRDGVKVIAQPTRFDPPRDKVGPDERFLVVYNDLSWTRSDVIRIKSPRENDHIASVREVPDGAALRVDLGRDGVYTFIAKDVPAFGYKTFRIDLANGATDISILPRSGRSIENEAFFVEVDTDGTIDSIRDLKANREMVNAKGELPFNELLRVEGTDASIVSYPVKATITTRVGAQMAEIEIERQRSAFPRTVITIYRDLNRVDLHNELDPAKFPFVGGNGNWSDSYYFAFPFNVSPNGLKILRGGQKWFDRLPDDYMEGARRDSVTTQHSIGLTDGKQTAIVAHRQAFHWVYSSFVSTKVRPIDAPKEFPAMFTGKFPLPEATLYSRAVRNSDQADTHDLSIVNLDTVEPGLIGNMIFDYAVAGQDMFDPVAAWRLGTGFNMPLRAEFVDMIPAVPKASYFSIDQPNVQIVTVKPFADSIIKGEVSSAPLNPQATKVFVIRLQEFAGRGGNVQIKLPAKIKTASIVSGTEDREISKVSLVSPLTVVIKPYQTLTVKVEIE